MDNDVKSELLNIKKNKETKTNVESKRSKKKKKISHIIQTQENKIKREK